MPDASPPFFTVVLPTFRRPAHLRAAVASVQAQTFADWELVLSDDEDPPGETWAYAQTLPEADSRIRVYRNPGPHGQAGNVNHALGRARGRWIKPLFDDDVLRPTCLTRFADVLARHPDVALAACEADAYRNDTLDRRARSGSRPKAERIRREDVHLALYLLDVEIGIPTQIAVNRACLDESTYMEDVPGLYSCVDFWWYARLLRKGDLVLLHEALVEQHQGDHATVTSRTSERELDREMAQIRAMVRPLVHTPGPPDLNVAVQYLVFTRALSRLRKGRVREAGRLLAGLHHPRAWYFSLRWLMRRLFPGHFALVARVPAV